MLMNNFDAYVHSPLRALITTAGVSAVTLNTAASAKSFLPEWAGEVVQHIISFPYMTALSYIAILLLIIERYYSSKIKRLEAKKLQQQIDRGSI